MQSYRNESGSIVYFTAYTESENIYHLGELEINKTITTGQERLDIFNSLRDMTIAFPDHIHLLDQIN